MNTTPHDTQSSPNDPPKPESPDPAATPPDSSNNASPDPLDSEARLAAMPPEVVAAAEAMLADPRLIDRIMKDIAAIGVVGESRLARILYLVGTSRLLSKPLSAIVQGLSSSGKSHLVEGIGDMLPEESVLRATDITGNALYYVPFGSLRHRFVIGGERSRLENTARAENTRALRELISAGKLYKVVTRRQNGQLITEEVFQPGPIAFVETTTLTEVFDEDANRLLQLSTDETAAQTRRVLDAQAVAATGERPEVTDILDRHHALQRLLRRCRVNIPFARLLAARIPEQRQEARRVLPQILAMIRAVCLLYQRQRCSKPLDHDSVLEATLEDYAIARELLIDPIGRALGGGPSEAVRRLGERLLAHFKLESFTTAEVMQTDPHVKSKSKVNEHLRTLEAHGAAECVVEGRGTRPAVWRMLGEVPQAGEVSLPPVEELRASFAESLGAAMCEGRGASSASACNSCTNCEPTPSGTAPGPQSNSDGVDLSDPSGPKPIGASETSDSKEPECCGPAAPVVLDFLDALPQFVE